MALAHFYNCVHLLIYKNKEVSYLATISIVFFVSQYKVGRFGGLFYIMKLTLGRFGRQRKEYNDKKFFLVFFLKEWIFMKYKILLEYHL